MRTARTVILYLLGVLLCYSISAQSDLKVVERGPHHKVFSDGSVRRYTELRNGMHFAKNGEWFESDPQITPAQYGAEAKSGPFIARFAHDLRSSPAIQINTPDGKLIKAQPLGLGYFDSASGASVILANVKSTAGEICGRNQVIYRNALDSVSADVLITVGSARFEADVILREQIATPETYGLSSATTRLEVYTEFIELPIVSRETLLLKKESNAAMRVSMREPDFTDERIRLGAIDFANGRAFLSSIEPLSSEEWPVGKKLVNASDRIILIESVVYNDVSSAVSKLPPGKPPVLSVPKLVRDYPRLASGSAEPRRMRVGEPVASSLGFVIDYVLVYNAGNFTFESGETYWVRPSPTNPEQPGGFGISGTALFKAGAVIKYNRNSNIYCYGGIQYSTGDWPVTFTAAADDSIGEALSGQTLIGKYASPALWLYYMTSGVTIDRFEFRHASTAIKIDSNPGVSTTHSVLNCRFQDDTTAIDDSNKNDATIIVDKPIFCNVSNPYWGTNLTGTIVGCVPLGSPSMTASFLNLTAGQVLSGNVTVQANSTGQNPRIGGELFVDGKSVDVDGGAGPYSFTFDTTSFPNGSKVVTVAMRDNGTVGSTDPDPLASENAPKFGVKTINVTFNNTLSNARLKYENFKPDLGQVQVIYGTWSSARSWRIDIVADDNPSTIFKSFSGSSSLMNVSWNGRDSNNQLVVGRLLNYQYFDLSQLGLAFAGPAPTKTIRAPSGLLGTFVVMYQGHHPKLGNYPIPTEVTGFISGDPNGPWGPLKSPATIARELAERFPQLGYYGDILANDDVWPEDFIPSAFGGLGTFDAYKIGLYIGHTVYSQNKIGGVHREAYLPLYDKASDTMSWVAQRQMSFGQGPLKYMAFYTCNWFRDPGYRTLGDYGSIKYNVSGTGLGIQPGLHIFCSFATEASIHPSFGIFWAAALGKKNPNPAYHTVIGAWRRVCYKTQPYLNDDNINVSRSVFWPECQGDYLDGYGPSTSPSPNNVQSDLIEDDWFAGDAP